MKTFMPFLSIAALIAAALVGVDGIFSGPGSSLFLFGGIPQRVAKLRQRGCQTGNFRAQICDPNVQNLAEFVELLTCVFDFVITGDLTTTEVRVDFATPFRTTPTVTANLAGLYFARDKNCTVAPTAISETGFNISIALGGQLPFELDINWMACDASVPAF